MGQKSGEKWTAAAKLQPTFPKPDRLLGGEITKQLAQHDPVVLTEPGPKLRLRVTYQRAQISRICTQVRSAPGCSKGNTYNCNQGWARRRS